VRSAARADALSGCGIGLRREHFDEILEGRPDVDFFEAISENFMIAGGRPLAVLERVRCDYPVALHGVSLSVGSAGPLDRAYLRRLKALADRIQPAAVSDHLCWTAIGGHNSHDLLPLPFTREAARLCAAKIAQAQDFLGRRILVENVSSYLEHASSEMTEAEFVAEVVEHADCGLLLDVNNLYVNARNQGLDPIAYLDRLPARRVAQIHLAGHEDHGELVIDTHDGPVCDAVWTLYAAALNRFGAVATLVEWDARVPALAAVVAEARRAEAIRSRVVDAPGEGRRAPAAA
jgi:uncharacterized protein